MREYTVIIEQDEDGWYVASVPELPGCHTQAKSLDQLRRRVAEAVRACREAEGAKRSRFRFVGIQRIQVPA